MELPEYVKLLKFFDRRAKRNMKKQSHPSQNNVVSGEKNPLGSRVSASSSNSKS